MNLNKHLSFFNPASLRKEEINIIGCGAIGSNVALQLAKLGVEKLVLWDFDIVNEHNITNQVYNISDIKQLKTDALEKHLKLQNPDIIVVKKGKYTAQPLKGILILAVDSIELRHKIAKQNEFNIMLRLVIDGRIGLETSQTYCIDWTKSENIENYLNLTDFKDNEVEVPISPCGTTLSVSPSVQTAVSTMVAFLINYANKEPNPTIVDIHAFKFKIVTR
jgi:hypothetical protein